MPVWSEWRDAENNYISSDKRIIGQKYTLVECYEKDYPVDSAFSRIGFIRQDIKVKE